MKKLTTNVSGQQASEFFREASLMLSLKDHPNVTKVFGMCQEAGNFSMVMEFLPNGSLDALIADQGQEFTEAFIWNIARGSAAGMASLASQHIVHRDLAARNILLGSDMSPKVADFGYARVVGEEAVGQTKTTVGPIRWMSPESIRDRQFSEKSDVWSYACMLYELLAREEPFKGLQLHDVAIKIRDHAASPGVPDKAYPWVSSLLKMCWAPEPEARPTFAKIVEILDSKRPEGAALLSPVTSDGVVSSSSRAGYEYFGTDTVKEKSAKKAKGKASKSKESSHDGTSEEDDRYIEMN